jgi:lysophospholipase L1-like esterase
LSPAGYGFGDATVVARAIERFNAIAREEAERAGASWVDLSPLMREQARKKMFAPDGLHQSAEAYAEWAGALATSMEAPPP